MLALANGHTNAANWMFGLAMICGLVAAVAFYFAPAHRAPRVLMAAAIALLGIGLLVS